MTINISEEALYRLNVEAAFARGCTIECLPRVLEHAAPWREVSVPPNWDWSLNRYRVKPTPTAVVTPPVPRSKAEILANLRSILAELETLP